MKDKLLSYCVFFIERLWNKNNRHFYFIENIEDNTIEPYSILHCTDIISSKKTISDIYLYSIYFSFSLLFFCLLLLLTLYSTFTLIFFIIILISIIYLSNITNFTNIICNLSKDELKKLFNEEYYIYLISEHIYHETPIESYEFKNIVNYFITLSIVSFQEKINTLERITDNINFSSSVFSSPDIENDLNETKNKSFEKYIDKLETVEKYRDSLFTTILFFMSFSTILIVIILNTIDKLLQSSSFNIINSASVSIELFLLLFIFFIFILHLIFSRRNKLFNVNADENISLIGQILSFLEKKNRKRYVYTATILIPLSIFIYIFFSYLNTPTPLIFLIISHIAVFYFFQVYFIKSYNSNKEYKEFTIFFNDITSKLNQGLNVSQAIQLLSIDNYKYLKHKLTSIKNSSFYKTSLESFEDFFSNIANSNILSFKDDIIDTIRSQDYNFYQISKKIDERNKFDKIYNDSYRNSLVFYIITIFVIVLLLIAEMYILGYEIGFNDFYYKLSMIFILVYGGFYIRFKNLIQKSLVDSFIMSFISLFFISVLLFFAQNFTGIIN